MSQCSRRGKERAGAAKVATAGSGWAAVGLEMAAAADSGWAAAAGSGWAAREEAGWVAAGGLEMAAVMVAG